jgi:hypothetical protein
MTVTLLCGLAFAGRFGAASIVVDIDAPLDVALQRLRSNQRTRLRPAVTESVMRDPDRWVEEHRSRLRSAV